MMYCKWIIRFSLRFLAVLSVAACAALAPLTFQIPEEFSIISSPCMGVASTGEAIGASGAYALYAHGGESISSYTINYYRKCVFEIQMSSLQGLSEGDTQVAASIYPLIGLTETLDLIEMNGDRYASVTTNGRMNKALVLWFMEQCSGSPQTCKRDYWDWAYAHVTTINFHVRGVFQSFDFISGKTFQGE